MFSNFLNEKSRRDFLKLSAAGVFGTSSSGLDERPGRAAAGDLGQPAPRPSTASSCGWTAAPATRTPST